MVQLTQRELACLADTSYWRHRTTTVISSAWEARSLSRESGGLVNVLLLSTASLSLEVSMMEMPREMYNR